MESPKEKTYHAAAHAVAPGSWLFKGKLCIRKCGKNHVKKQDQKK